MNKMEMIRNAMDSYYYNGRLNSVNIDSIKEDLSDIYLSLVNTEDGAAMVYGFDDEELTSPYTSDFIARHCMAMLIAEKVKETYYPIKFEGRSVTLTDMRKYFNYYDINYMIALWDLIDEINQDRHDYFAA